MCRILASISDESISMKKQMIDDPCSLLNQSTARKDKLQQDGWGVAWYDGSWNIEKSPMPVFEEKEKLERLAERKYSLMIAHIRKASNPMDLPIEKLRAYENTQPFHYNNWVFAHNGQINYPDKVKSSMGEWAERVQGINDSEVYFWLLMKYIEEMENVRDAIKCAIEHLYEVQNEIGEEKDPFTALNMVLSDGERLYALCKYDGRGKESLCFKDRPYYQMQYLKTEKGAIIASEKTSQDGWKPIEDGNLLVVERDGSFRMERL
jgi:predicted glutamine amidotransferase